MAWQEASEWESDGDRDIDLCTLTVWENGNISATIETSDGDVYHIGDNGGMTVDWWDDLYDELGDDMYEYLCDQLDEDVYGK